MPLSDAIASERGKATAANEADCKNLRLVMLNAIFHFLLCKKIYKAYDSSIKRMLCLLFNF